MTNNLNFDEILTRSRELTATISTAAATIESLTTNPTPNSDPYRPNTKYDDARNAFRDLLCDDDEMPDDLDLLTHDDFDALRDALAIITANASERHDARELLTTYALDNSLCPLHLCDYQSCFDDADDECAAIRLIHPSHDT